MAGIPKVKITFDADFAELKRGVKGATDEVEGFGSRVGDFAKKAGAAFAIAGAAAAAYAGKLLVDGVKAAIEDEAAQVRLATSLENVAGATKNQIAQVEDQILKTSLLTGVTDEQLRPSLDRLLRSTKDVEEAQKLQNLALDIAAGSGKSLEAVSNALGKAYEGNTGALGKLGVGISAAELKTMSFDQVTAKLSQTFEGQATKQAETFSGKMQRLSVAFDEAKETVGSFVLDAITPLVSNIVNNIIPAVQNFASNLGETLGPQFAQIAAFIRDELFPALQTWWTFLIDEIIPAILAVVKPVLEGLFNAFDIVRKAVKDNSAELQPFFDFLKKIWEFVKTYLAPIIGETLKFALEAIANLIANLIGGFAKLTNFISDAYNMIKKFVEYVKANPVVKGISTVIDNVFGGGKAAGGFVNSSKTYLVGEKGPELFTPSGSGNIIPNNKLSGGGTTINLTVNGAIDAEGTARTIVDILNRSSARGTLGAAKLVSG
ncbi:hypothetical protein UFOVP490_6 [uncultured Caudovirales phage]|uniref:Bacteriophage lambda, GpH, tail tape measure, C-terminal n=1 Tax=uncultured Caudovirales phage TaxID=2100421 RepID=A0A6J5RF75_9CAUD|nr:hypothetical protein UFOVP490_6 [uncultured Caudovirales phage]CAB4191085.1 hypothetical protein UFOVP1220_7 [uncultured Caudovirales phage]